MLSFQGPMELSPSNTLHIERTSAVWILSDSFSSSIPSHFLLKTEDQLTINPPDLPKLKLFSVPAPGLSYNMDSYLRNNRLTAK
jgi:hypothetical protein